MKICLEQIKTDNKFHGEKKSGFVDSGFVKTWDELVIGEEEGIQLRKQKREQQLFKRRNVHTEEIIQVIFIDILFSKIVLAFLRKKYSSDWEKLLKFKANDREFLKFWDHKIEQYSNNERPEWFLKRNVF